MGEIGRFAGVLAGFVLIGRIFRGNGAVYGGIFGGFAPRLSVYALIFRIHALIFCVYEGIFPVCGGILGVHGGRGGVLEGSGQKNRGTIGLRVGLWPVHIGVEVHY